MLQLLLLHTGAAADVPRVPNHQLEVVIVVDGGAETWTSSQSDTPYHPYHIKSCYTMLWNTIQHHIISRWQLPTSDSHSSAQTHRGWRRPLHCHCPSLIGSYPWTPATPRPPIDAWTPRLDDCEHCINLIIAYVWDEEIIVSMLYPYSI